MNEKINKLIINELSEQFTQKICNPETIHNFKLAINNLEQRYGVTIHYHFENKQPYIDNIIPNLTNEPYILCPHCDDVFIKITNGACNCKYIEQAWGRLYLNFDKNSYLRWDWGNGHNHSILKNRYHSKKNLNIIPIKDNVAFSKKEIQKFLLLI